MPRGKEVGTNDKRWFLCALYHRLQDRVNFDLVLDGKLDSMRLN